MFHHLDPQLEPAVAKAVEQLRLASNRSRVATGTNDELAIEATAEEVRALCEVTSSLLSQMLVSSGDWPDERFVDGLIPISVDTSAPNGVELAGGAIVSESESDSWKLEPLLARFFVSDGSVNQFVLLFGHGQKDPADFDPNSEHIELEFPEDEDEGSWRYSFSATEEPLGS